MLNLHHINFIFLTTVGGASVYSEPKLPTYDPSQYDVPPVHRQPVPEPSLYNVPPTANQPLSTSPHESSVPPPPHSAPGGAGHAPAAVASHTQNGGQNHQHQVDAFDMGKFLNFYS